ncbi:UDPGP type 1 family protein [bacterium]|nr:UDPGP type 1 family protein [bacterium]
MPDRYDELLARAEAHGQGHVFQWWDELDDGQRDTLLAQVAEVDFEVLDRLIEEHVKSSQDEALGELTPAEPIPLPSTPEELAEHERAVARGEEMLRAGQVAALVAAGGSGTRLGYDGPKGTFAASPIAGKPLFQLLAEKILAASRRYGAPIPWYVMTSEANDEPTRAFFEEHGCFGLPATDVCFFVQGTMPTVGMDGRILLEEKWKLVRSANGHGGTLRALGDRSALADMQSRGIRVISYFQVDNPLVKAIDPAFLGFHDLRGSEFSSKALPKRDPEEGLGVSCHVDGQMRVVEYTDLPCKQKYARRDDGRLLFEAGSIAIHALNVDFVARVVNGGARLPFHRAHKKVACLDANGRRLAPAKPNGVRFEMFIFDALLHAKAPMVMMTDRAEEFAPIKNAEGADSPATSREAQVEQFARWLEAAGVAVPRDGAGKVQGAVEISALRADSAETLRQKLPADTVFGGELNLQ